MPPDLRTRVSARAEKLTLSGLNRLRRFTLDGAPLRYCVHDYNTAWHNERTVEVPIAASYLATRGTGQTLEVGNVLTHYGVSEPRIIVDKYEQAPGVLNVDVVDYDPGEVRFDLIVSISTLEHAGYDEDVKEPDKPVRAVRHLRQLLAPHGVLVVTVPLGYNPAIDIAVRGRAFAFDHVSYLRRVSRLNRWRQVNLAELSGARYNAPFPAANVIVVGTATGPLPA
jgi:SAM-dependent methyltransferase